MSDEFDFEDDDEIEVEQPRDNVVTLKRSDIRSLEKKAKRAEEAEAVSKTLERKLAFYEAGVPKTKQSEYFMKGYDGDLTADAIRAAAIDAGFLEESSTDASPDEVAGHQRMANASVGASDDSFDHDAAIAAANTVEEIVAASQKAGFPTTHDGF